MFVQTPSEQEATPFILWESSDNVARRALTSPGKPDTSCTLTEEIIRSGREEIQATPPCCQLILCLAEYAPLVPLTKKTYEKLRKIPQKPSTGS
jgi:hypothetical protein